jgi:DNA ligase-1
MTFQGATRRDFLTRLAAGLLCFGTAQARPRSAPADLLLANEMPDGASPDGYLVSEKFDGVRAVWDGRTLRFRSGRTVAAPAWFLKRLPAEQPLDGELWLARGRFEALSGIVRKNEPVDADWRQVRYMVFELPQAAGSFAARALRMQAIAARLAWPALQAVEQFEVADHQALRQRLDEVVAAGGEGLVLHRADALYATGRSDLLWKLKPVQDSDALVIAHIPGQGRLEGRLGALEVRLPDGRRLLIGTGLSDALRADPPAVGTTVTYTYRGTTRTGLPRFASFLRVRDPV